MSYQKDIPFVLNSHDSKYLTMLVVAGKYDSIVDLIVQFGPCHVWIVPPVFWNNTFISNGCVSDDLVDVFEIISRCFSNHLKFLSIQKASEMIPVRDREVFPIYCLRQASCC